MAKKGNRMFVVPDGFSFPGEAGGIPSHESLCVLNMNDEDAYLTMTAYYTDK